MGLDISVVKYKDLIKSQKLQQQFDIGVNLIWKKYFPNEGDLNNATQDMRNDLRQQRNVYKQQFMRTHNTDEYGRWGFQEFCETSLKYPDHLFGLGYFRSSYNDSGINRVLGNTIKTSLSDIFQYTDEQFVFKPNWNKSLQNLKNTLSKFDKYIEEVGSVNYMCEMYPIHTSKLNELLPKNEVEALEIYNKEKQRDHSFCSSYGNMQGVFYMEQPIKVRALIPGFDRYQKDKIITYVVFQNDMQWYRQAIEIMIESVEYILKQQDMEQYYLHWSS